MFDFREFLSKGLVDGVRGGQTRYALTMRAASLVEKGMLDTEDLKPLAAALDERDAEEKAAEKETPAEKVPIEGEAEAEAEE